MEKNSSTTTFWGKRVCGLGDRKRTTLRKDVSKEGGRLLAGREREPTRSTAESSGLSSSLTRKDRRPSCITSSPETLSTDKSTRAGRGKCFQVKERMALEDQDE